MKIKKLEPTKHGYANIHHWVMPLDYAYYTWSGVTKRVFFNWRTMSDEIGTAQTLEEADKLVQAHHEQQVRALMDTLLEPPQWQEGEIPEPEGPSVLVVELKSGVLKAIPACSDQEERYWSQSVTGYTNNRRLILPITLPETPAT